MRGKRRRTASTAAGIWAIAGSLTVVITVVMKQMVIVMKEITVRTAVPAIRRMIAFVKTATCVWNVL